MRGQESRAGEAVGARLLARRCPLPSRTYHERALHGARGERARYHRAWLRHLDDPLDPGRAPLVSVVVPVRDGNPWIGDAAASVLAQTWPRVELVVVDDGSQESPERVLPRDARIRVLHEPPRGVAGARNRGVRAARGALVHFLDADDWLDVDCVARKMEAFRRVPDADVCVSSYRAVGGHEEKDARTHRPPPLGDALCPTRDLLETVVRRYPFHTSTVLAARWMLLETGPMDERLEHGEDSRYWFRLAVRGAKVIALDRELGTRRFVTGGLTSQRPAQELSWARVSLLNLTDMIAAPPLWVHLGTSLYRFAQDARVRLLPEDPLLAKLAEELLVRVEEAPECARALGLSAAPALALVEACALERIASAPSPQAARFGMRLAEAARRAAARGSAPGEADVRLWLGHRCRRARCRSRPAFELLERHVESRLRRGGMPLPPDRMWALAGRLGPQVGRRWSRALRLRPLLGARGSFALVRAWDGVARTPGRGWRRVRATLRIRTRLRVARVRRQPRP